MEVVLAFSGQLVDDPGPATAGAGVAGRCSWLVVGRCVLGDPASFNQVAQARIQGPEGQRPKGAEDGIESLAQLVTVHRGVVKEPQDGELQQCRTSTHAGLTSWILRCGSGCGSRWMPGPLKRHDTTMSAYVRISLH